MAPSLALQLGPLSRPYNVSSRLAARAAPSPSFVRPDCPPVKEQHPAPRGPTSSWPRTSDEAATLAAGGQNRPVARFRSALEQVSFETNKQLLSMVDGEGAPQRARKPFLGLLGL